MKKWVKGVLIAAVVLVLIGGIMSIICLVLGASWSDANISVRNIKSNRIQTENSDVGDAKIWTLNSEEIHSIRLSVGAGRMYVQTGDEYRVEVRNFRDGMRCEVKNGVLIVDEETGFSAFSWIGFHGENVPIITVTIPEGTVFEEAEISVGAGSLEADCIKAETAKLDVDAGYITCNLLEVSGSCEMDVDAGSLEVNGGSCLKKLQMDVDAGAISVLDFDGGTVQMDVDAGSIEYSGTIQGDWKADCDVGSVEITLDAAETDYNYMLDSDLGSIQIGRQEFARLSSSQNINNGARFNASLDNAMGSIEVKFTR